MREREGRSPAHPRELLSAVERHACADGEERAARGAILALLARGERAFSRSELDAGHITGSAFVLDAARERVLLVHHARLDRWLQPGGHAEPGETDGLATALREAAEETGLAGLALHPSARRPFDLDVHRIPGREGERAHDHHDVRYVLVAPPGAEPRCSEESRAVAWRALATLEDGDPAFRRAILKLRAL